MGLVIALAREPDSSEVVVGWLEALRRAFDQMDRLLTELEEQQREEEGPAPKTSHTSFQSG